MTGLALSPLNLTPMASVATLNLANTTTLNNPTLGFSYSGTTVTFNATSAGQEYTIQGNGGSTVRSIQFVSGADAIVYLDGVTVSGNTGGPALGIASGADVTLNLVDGTTNTFSSTGNYAGIQVPAGATVTIDGDTGILNSSSASRAGIGGGIGSVSGNITITGGIVTATGGAYGAGIGGTSAAGGNTTITGGTVTAKSNGAAGIGGGSGGAGGTITITGGTVTTASNSSGAGIGGGPGGAGGNITIGGNANVTVTYPADLSGNAPAAIGGGTSGASGTILITDYAVIDAKTSRLAAVIGPGYLGALNNITISGHAKVKAMSSLATTWSQGGSAIGSNNGSPNGGTVNILEYAEVEAFGAATASGIGGGGNASGSHKTITLNIADTTTIEAFSQGTWAAVDATNTGTGYYVNAKLDTSVNVSSGINLRAFKLGDESNYVDMPVPALYRAFGVSTGSASQDYYTIYQMSADGTTREKIAVIKGTSDTRIPSQQGATPTLLTLAEIPPDGMIDYQNETIINLTTAVNPNAQTWLKSTSYSYATNSGTWTNVTSGVSGSGVATLTSFGAAPNPAGGADQNVFLAYSSTGSTSLPNSTVQQITIVPRPAAPTSPTGATMEIAGLATDGSMEYRKSTDSTWTTYSGTTGTAAVASGGTYLVRIKAVESYPTPAYNNGSFHSASKTVTVLDATPLGAIDYINEAVSGLTATNSPGVATWLYSTDYDTGAGTGTWTPFTPDSSGSSTLASLGGSAPNAYSGAEKKLYLAYSTLPSASAPSSAVETLTIKARPATPTGIAGGADEITGVVVGTQEYRRQGETWQDVVSSPQGTTTTGVFYVRIKAVPNSAASPLDNGSFASASVSATVLSTALISINGGADMSLSYPSDLETVIKDPVVTVTPSSGTITWYYSTSLGGPYTAGFPDKPDTYYIYATVTASSIYAEATSTTIQVTWNKKLLEISPDDKFTKVYDQTTDVTTLPSGFPKVATGAVGESGDVEPGDTVSVTRPASLSAYSFAYASTAAGNTVSAQATSFSLSGNAAGGTNNAGDYYTLGTGTLTWAAEITPKPVTVDFTGGMIFTKTYDGTYDATNSGSAPSLSGTESGDSVTLNSDAVGYFYGTNSSTTNVNAGTGQNIYLKLATANSFYLEGTDAPNYSLMQPAQTTPVSITGIITQKIIDAAPANYDTTYGIDWYFDASTSPETVSSASPTPSILYTGSLHTISAKVKPSALARPEDDVTITLEVAGASATSPGSYSATSVDTGATTLGGTEGKNYLLSNSLNQPWQIAGTLPGSPYDLDTNSQTDPTNVVFSWQPPIFDGGSAITNYQVEYITVSGIPAIANLQESDWASATVLPLVTASPTPQTTVDLSSGILTSTTYAWRVRATNSTNPLTDDDFGPWSVPSSANPDTVAPAITVSPALSCIYGDTLGDILLASQSAIKATGTIPIASVYTAGDPLPGTWTWRDSGGISNDTIPSNNLPGTTDTYTLVFTPDPTVASVYGANTTDVTITIQAKPLIIVYDNMQFVKRYDGLVEATNLDSGPHIDSSGIIDGNGDGTLDDVSVSVSGVHYVYDDANANTGKSVYLDGSGQNYTLTGTDAINYSIDNLPTPRTGGAGGTPVVSTGVITQRPLTFNWTLDTTPITNPVANTNSVVFDGDPHTLTATASGMVSGESVAVNYSSSGQSATNADSYQASVASISVSNAGGPNAGTVSTNYDIGDASAVQDWQITKRLVSVHWTDLSFVYDTNAHLPIATYAKAPNDASPAALSVNVTRGPVDASGDAIDAGIYAALATIAPTANYTLTGTTTEDFNITQKLLTLDFSNILAKLASLPYSGETSIDITPDTMPTLDEGSSAGQVYPTDNLGTGVVLEAGNAKWHLSGSDVAGGPYNLNIDGDFALSGSRAANYVLVPGQSWQMMSNVANIAPRPLDFSWELDGKPISGTSIDVPHDGMSHTVTAIVTNAVTGQVLTVATYSTSSTLTATDDGSYTATVASVASGDGGITNPANYTLSGATNATLTWNIVKAVDKSALIALEGKILAEDLHEQNYTAAAWSALQSALTDANTVINDASATQTQVNAALAALQSAYDNLRHDHPELRCSHDIAYGGVNHLTRFGDTVIIEFKGDIRDVTGFRLNGTNYPLTSGGVNVYNITEGGTTVGTITKGSAVVTLPAPFADRLANGTHTVEVIFTDATGTGVGIAELIVDRSGGGNDPSDGPAILPKMGDSLPVELILAATFSTLCGLLLLMLACRRRRKKEKA